jgi:hypothetical protein
VKLRKPHLLLSSVAHALKIIVNGRKGAVVAVSEPSAHQPECDGHERVRHAAPKASHTLPCDRWGCVREQLLNRINHDIAIHPRKPRGDVMPTQAQCLDGAHRALCF